MQVLSVFLSIGLKAMLNGTLDRQAARDRNRQSIVDETRATLPQEEPERRRTPGRAVRYEETGASVAGREKMRGALGNCAIFRISERRLGAQSGRRRR
jgi:hypothetical protein